MGPGEKQVTYVCETAHSGSNGLGVGESDVMPTLDTANSKAVCIQGSMIGRSDANGPQGSGIETDGACYTLNCTDRHAVCIADDNAKAAVDVEVSGTLKCGGSAPMVAR